MFNDILEYIAMLLPKINMDIQCYIEIYFSKRVRMRNQVIEDVSEFLGCGGQFRIYENNELVNMLTFNSISSMLNYLLLITASKSKEVNIEERICSDFINLKKNVESTYLMKSLYDVNQKLLRVKGMDNVIVTYGDIHKKKYIIRPSGKIIFEEKNDSIANFITFCTLNNNSVCYPISLGSNGNPYYISALDEFVLKPIQISLKEKIVPFSKPGKYTIILDPVLTGNFIHEILGHLLEADSICENHKLKEKLVLGSRLAVPQLSVEDRPDINYLRGSYKFDDEGNEGKGTVLLKKGVLKSYLHSERTAKIFKTKSTGNGRLINFRYPPLVRMSNTRVCPGRLKKEELFTEVKSGYFLKGFLNASTDTNKFIIIPAQCIKIDNGELKESVCNVAWIGGLEMLQRIVDCSQEQEIYQGGSCSKKNQDGLSVASIAPYMLIEGGYLERMQ